MPATLTPEGIAVLLVYGAKIEVARGDQPGIRVTAGYHDGSVLLEAVGFACPTNAVAAIQRAHDACVDAGLDVRRPTRRTSNNPARLVWRRL